VDNEQHDTVGLVANTDYIPLWLSFAPSETLSKLGFDVSKMLVTDERSFQQGKECIELAVPRKPLPCHVYVDPSLGYLPIKYISWRRFGQMRTEIDIWYKPDQALGWVVSTWESKLYDGQQNVETTLSGEVQSTRINQQISDEVFDIAFPVGTHLRETPMTPDDLSREWQSSLHSIIHQ
jgi:hypothetical protein